MLTDSDISKILTVFKRAHLIDSSYIVQPYNRDNVYRTGILITVSERRESDYVFVNVELSQFTPWKEQMWEKHKDKIGLEAFRQESKNPAIIRLGFK